MKKGVWWFVGVGVMLALLVIGQWPDDALHVIGCDVGQGDATLVMLGSTQVLVDAGPASGAVLECLSGKMPFWDRTIEMVVLSHPQMDHMGGMEQVLARYRVGVLVTADSVNDIEAFWRLFELVQNEEVRVVEADRGLALKLGQMEWEILWPVDELPESFVWDMGLVEDGEYSQVLGVQQVLEVQEEDINDESVVMRLTYGEVSVLFTGDIGVQVEHELVDDGFVGEVDVLKVAHHGSRFSTTDYFLNSAKPKIGLIYSGKNNRYGHPNDQVISRLEALGTRLMRTDKEGEVELVTDGLQWYIEGE